MADEVPNTPSTTIPKSSGTSLPEQLSQWLNLYSQVAGGPTVTETTKSNVTADQAAAMLQRALGSNGVLANIGAQERTAGAGRSSGAMFARNDLMSKLAADLAAKQAGTTTTKQVGGVAGKGAVTGAAGAAGLYSLYQFLKGSGLEPGEQTPWEAIKGGWDSMFGSSAGAGSNGTGASTASSFDLGNYLNNFNAFSSGGLDSLSALMGNTGGAETAASGASGSLGPADMSSMTDAGSSGSAAATSSGADAATAASGADAAVGSINPMAGLSSLNTMNDVVMNYDEKHQASALFAAIGAYLGGPQGAAIGNELGKSWIGQQTDQGIYQTGQNFRGINNWDNVASNEFDKFNSSWAGTELNNGLNSIDKGITDVGNSVGKAADSLNVSTEGIQTSLNDAEQGVNNFIKSILPW